MIIGRVKKLDKRASQEKKTDGGYVGVINEKRKAGRDLFALGSRGKGFVTKGKAKTKGGVGGGGEAPQLPR